MSARLGGQGKASSKGLAPGKGRREHVTEGVQRTASRRRPCAATLRRARTTSAMAGPERAGAAEARLRINRRGSRLAAELQCAVDDRPAVMILAETVGDAMEITGRVDKSAPGRSPSQRRRQSRSRSTGRDVPPRGDERRPRDPVRSARRFRHRKATASAWARQPSAAAACAAAPMRVTGVELAIAKGALAIFPRPPAMGSCSARSGNLRPAECARDSISRPLLQPMRQRRIMEETGRVRGAVERVQKKIGFGRVEIAG